VLFKHAPQPLCDASILILKLETFVKSWFWENLGKIWSCVFGLLLICHGKWNGNLLFYVGMLLQPVITGLPGGPQTKYREKRKEQNKQTTIKHKIVRKNNDTI